MACTYKFNGLNLSEEQFNKLASRAVEEIKKNNESVTHDLVEKTMTDIVYGLTNELTGFSYDPATVTNRFVKAINYKESLVRRLEKQMRELLASRAKFAAKSKEYNDINIMITEIKSRLDGKGYENDEAFIPGLRREIKILKNTDSIAVLTNMLISDKARLKIISQRNDPYSINEVHTILSFYNALQNINPEDKVDNPIFLKSELLAGVNTTIQALRNMGKTITDAYSKEVTKREIEWLSIVIKNDADLMNIAGIKRDQIRKKRELQGKTDAEIDDYISDYQIFFGQPMNDITIYDKYFMDGIVGTFSDFGQLTQSAEKILRDSLRKYESIDAINTEELTAITPAVNKRLIEMGHGINLLGIKVNLFGLSTAVGASYDFFRQKYANGKRTNRMVDRNSAEYLDAWGKSKSEFDSAIKRANEGVKGVTSIELRAKAHMNRDNWRRRHTIQFDIRKIKEIRENPEFARYQNHFVIDDSHEQELKQTLKSDKGYNKMLEEQKEAIRTYMAEYDSFVKEHFAQHSVSSIKDLPVSALEEIAQFEILNNPFKAAKYFATGQVEYVHGYRFFPRMNYNRFIARRYAIADTPIVQTTKDSGKEIEYNVTSKETGYYDNNFATIENDDVLSKFYDIATKIMDSKKYLPLDQQRELAYGVIAGKTKSFTDILFDPSVTVANKFSPAMIKMTDNFIKALSIVKGTTRSRKSAVDSITGHEDSEVTLGLVQTNGAEIKRNFRVAGINFVDSLKGGYDLSYRNVTSGKNKFNKYSVVQFKALTNESKELLSQYLDSDNSDGALMLALGIATEEDNFPIGNIIYKDVVDKIVEKETFNLPQALKLYSGAVALYAARNAAMPVIDMMKKHFQAIEKSNLTNTGEEKDTKDKELRVRANRVFDRWFNKQVLGNLSQTGMDIVGEKMRSKLKERDDNKHSWGINVALSSLSYDEKIMDHEIDKAIASEEAKSPETRSQTIIDQLKEDKERLGRNFSALAFYDRFVDLVRMVGLALSPLGAFKNYTAGKASNYIAAASGLYFKESSLFKAEHIVIGSHIKLATDISSKTKNWSTEGARKVAIMMQRFKVFQDSSDEIYKSSLDTGISTPSVMNIYILQQRTEYVNQAPVLIAMMIDTMIKGKDAQGNEIESTVWDALDAHGKLKEGFNTKENKENWEVADSHAASQFINKVTNVIKNIHGDYSSLGGSVYSNDVLFKTMMMFKRWMSRYIHTRLGIEYPDQALERTMKGRYRSLTAGSASALGGIAALAISGLNPVGLVAGIVGAGLVAHYKGMSRSNISTGDQMLNYLKDLNNTFLQVAMKAIVAPVKIPVSITAGKNIFEGTKFNDFLDNGHRDNDLDNGNMNANMTEMSLVIVTLMTRLILKALTKDRDKDEDDGLINLAINLCGSVIQDLTMFMNPAAIYNAATKYPIGRTYENINKLGDISAQILFEDGSDVVVGGVDNGKSRIGELVTKTIFPAILRDRFGAGSYMDKVMSNYGLDKNIVSTEKYQMRIIEKGRLKVKNQVVIELTKEQLTQENIDSIAKQIMADNPNMSERLAKRKAERYLKEDIKKEAIKAANDIIPTLGQRDGEYTNEELEQDIEESLKNSGVK